VSRATSAAKRRYVPRADRWYASTAAALQHLPAPVRDWVGWPDSLTERLADHLADPVRVRVLSERHDRLLNDEREHLQLLVRSARVREAQLEVRDTPYVIARTAFPDATARVMDHALRRLGSRSLGTLLFGVPRAPVRARQFARLEPHSALWRTLAGDIRPNVPPETRHLWARRTLHMLHGQPLLVTEVFLPRLLTGIDRRLADSGPICL
jgi:chorismate--pyruvate lyase